ncbi:glycosyltransferase family 2 protein [Ornithinimicrobium avium]|nr:galactosyltransferase-related protein [Ornithinimicrobium avium]
MPLQPAVLTMAKGGHQQLLHQVDGLSVGSVPPLVHCVISMGDRDLTRGRLPLGTDRWTTLVRPIPSDRRALPLAGARNLAAEMAVEAGAEVLVFLGGHVIPGSRTLERFAEAVSERPAGLPDGPVVYVGPLLHLPEPEEAVGYPFGRLDEVALPAPGIDPPEPGRHLGEPSPERFDGRAFAMSARDFRAAGGFCADYTGHGLEDADFAEKVTRAGGAFVHVGGATAYVQPVEPPDLQTELRVALRHAGTWRSRWGGDPVEHPLYERLLGSGVLRRTESGGFVAG